MKRLLLCAAGAACAAYALAPNNAAASGFALREDSAVGIGTAFSGDASSAADLSTIFTNPAGMAYFTGTQVQADAIMIFEGIHFTGSSTSVGGTVSTGGAGSVDAGRSVPDGAMYAMTNITPDLSAGIAITTPFGLETIYPNGWAGRYLALKTTTKATDFNPNLAYRINNWLSVGGGLSAQAFEVDASQAINSTGAATKGASAPNSVLPDGQGEIHGRSWGWGFNLGAMAEPIEGTRLGLAYRSRVQHTIEGFYNASVPSAIAGAAPALASSPFRAPITLPATTSLGITQVITPQLAVMGELEYTQWSSVQKLVVSNPSGGVINTNLFSFRDTWFGSIGAKYALSDQWAFTAGFGFDQSPVTDYYRTVLLPDNDRTIVGLGAFYTFNPHVKLTLAYTHYFFPSTTINSSINTNSGTGDVLRGSYDNSADEAAASLHVTF